MPAKTLKKEEEKAIAEMYQGGASSVFIGRKFGVAPSTVMRVLRDFGVPARSISEASALRASEQPVGGRYNGRKGVFQSQKMGKWIPSASTYEYMRMQQLEDDKDVLLFDRCKDRVPYTISGKTHHYTPDIVVVRTGGRVIVEEVKPLAMTARTEVRTKAAAAAEFYSRSGATYLIVTEKEIGEQYIASFDWSGITGAAQVDLDAWQKMNARKRAAEWAREKRKRCPPTNEQKAKHASRTREYAKRWMDSATEEQKAEKRAKAAEYKRNRLRKLKAATNQSR